jgi:hypothetical protein
MTRYEPPIGSLSGITRKGTTASAALNRLLTADETIELRDGVRVKRAALEWLWAGEDRGLKIGLTGDGGDLMVGPDDALTPGDRAVLAAHRDALAIVVWWCNLEAGEGGP